MDKIITGHISLWQILRNNKSKCQEIAFPVLALTVKKALINLVFLRFLGQAQWTDYFRATTCYDVILILWHETRYLNFSRFGIISLYWTGDSEETDRKQGKRDGCDRQQRSLAGIEPRTLHFFGVRSNHSASRPLPISPLFLKVVFIPTKSVMFLFFANFALNGQSKDKQTGNNRREMDMTCNKRSQAGIEPFGYWSTLVFIFSPSFLLVMITSYF